MRRVSIALFAIGLLALLASGTAMAAPSNESVTGVEFVTADAAVESNPTGADRTGETIVIDNGSTVQLILLLEFNETELYSWQASDGHGCDSIDTSFQVLNDHISVSVNTGTIGVTGDQATDSGQRATYLVASCDFDGRQFYARLPIGVTEPSSIQTFVTTSEPAVAVLALIAAAISMLMLFVSAAGVLRKRD